MSGAGSRPIRVAICRSEESDVDTFSTEIRWPSQATLRRPTYSAPDPVSRRPMGRARPRRPPNRCRRRGPAPPTTLSNTVGPCAREPICSWISGARVTSTTSSTSKARCDARSMRPAQPCFTFISTNLVVQAAGAKVDHGSGGTVPLRRSKTLPVCEPFPVTGRVGRFIPWSCIARSVWRAGTG